jgi:general secretion pathway protein G
MVKRQGSGIRAQGSGCSADTNSALAPLRPLAEPWALGPDPCAGFTLVELMVVMAIIAILATIAIPSFTANVKHAREAVLREDLFTMRGAIDQYTSDKQKAPQSLDDLVQSGYLREMPKDPFTHRTDTWIPDEGSILTTLDETAGGIDNVHSGSQDVATDGTTYNTW